MSKISVLEYSTATTLARNTFYLGTKPKIGIYVRLRSCQRIKGDSGGSTSSDP
ncbi:MAG: hypothetical protein ACP5GI_08055 [Sulfolobales archaeon]